MNQINTFAGLYPEDLRGEFFSREKNKVQLIAGGKLYQNYADIPDKYRHVVRARLIRHPEALIAFRDAGITSRLEREERYTWCMCASLSLAADIDPVAGSLTPEVNVLCSECQYRQAFCMRSIGLLTATETKVAIFIGRGYSDKEIAIKLIKSPATITTHRRAIQRKLLPVFGRPANAALISNLITKEGLL